MKKILLSLLLFINLSACTTNEGTNKQEKNTFVVGMECAYAPFNYQTSTPSSTSVEIEGGYCDGYDVMIAREIAKGLNKELVIKKISWNGLGVALESGDIDAIIAGMTADEKREEGIDFTDPYYDSQGMIMIVRKGSKESTFTSIQDFSGMNVIGQLNTNYDSVIDQIENVNHITPKATYPEMIVALQAGDVDAITAEMAVAKGVIEANKDLTVVEFIDGKGFECDTTVSIGLKEGSRDSDFYNTINDILTSINTDTRASMMAQAVANQPVEE